MAGRLTRYEEIKREKTYQYCKCVCVRVCVSWSSAMQREFRLVEMLKAQKQIEQDNTVDMRENLET